MPLKRLEKVFSLIIIMFVTKIVPGVELSYVSGNGSKGGAVLTPFFSQCNMSPLFRGILNLKPVENCFLLGQHSLYFTGD